MTTKKVGMRTNKNNRIILSSYCKGHNFGSILQCFALKKFLENNDYEVAVVDEKNKHKKKLITLVRGLFHLNLLKKIFKASRQTGHNISSTQHQLFENDILRLNIKTLSFSEAKKYSADSLCCVCGSDQIWNTEALYINPFYFLSFSPFDKNIAYAPSLGRNYVPKFNEKKIMNYIKNIRFLSTREEYNCSLLSKLSFGRRVQSVCDPVFLLSKIEWQQLLDSAIKEANDYVLCYFLDTPNEDVAMQIVLLLRGLNKSVLFLGNAMQKFSSFFNFAYKFVDVSAFSFPEMVFSSTVVLTDSFHGIAFSIVGEKNVYWFPRNYISGESQDVRILSLLKTFSIVHANDFELIKKENSNELIEEYILSSKTFLLSSVEAIKNE